MSSLHLEEELLSISCENNSEFPILLTLEGRERLKSLCEGVLIKGKGSQLIDWLKNEDLSPAPLEMLWTLHSYSIVKISTYIYCHPDFSDDLAEHLVDLVFCLIDSNELEISKNIVIDFLVYFINMWKPLEKDVHPHCAELLENFILKVNSKVYDGHELKFNYLNGIVETGHVIQPQLRLFVIYQFKRLLANEFESVAMFSAVSIQTKQWTTKTMELGMQQILKQIFLMLPVNDIFDEICGSITEHTFNWKVLLTSVSVFVTMKPENADLMKDSLDNWFKEAVANKDKMLLNVVLLVSRQCCAENVRNFSNYPGWFGSLQLKTVAAFTCFYQLLSDIVPYELALNLKIHVNKVPSAPPSCQSLLIDYLTLAKTRLADLNETTDYIGLFNDCHDSDLEGQDSDIARVIAHFKENKDIPKAVFEASVFRRQYFEKIFLNRLLSVSEKVDPDRAEVILKLHLLGKISNSLYTAWKNLSND